MCGGEAAGVWNDRETDRRGRREAKPGAAVREGWEGKLPPGLAGGRERAGRRARQHPTTRSIGAKDNPRPVQLPYDGHACLLGVRIQLRMVLELWSALPMGAEPKMPAPAWPRVARLQPRTAIPGSNSILAKPLQSPHGPLTSPYHKLHAALGRNMHNVHS